MQADPAPLRPCRDLRRVAAVHPEARDPARALHRELVARLAQHLERLGLAGPDAAVRARVLLAAVDGLVLQVLLEPGEPDVRGAQRLLGRWVAGWGGGEEG